MKMTLSNTKQILPIKKRWSMRRRRRLKKLRMKTEASKKNLKRKNKLFRRKKNHSEKSKAYKILTRNRSKTSIPLRRIKKLFCTTKKQKEICSNQKLKFLKETADKKRKCSKKSSKNAKKPNKRNKTISIKLK